MVAYYCSHHSAKTSGPKWLHTQLKHHDLQYSQKKQYTAVTKAQTMSWQYPQNTQYTMCSHKITSWQYPKNTQYTALKKQYPIRYNKSSQNSIRIFTACYKTQYKQPRYSHNLDAKYSHFAWMIWPSINRTGLHQGSLQTDFYQETY